MNDICLFFTCAHNKEKDCGHNEYPAILDDLTIDEAKKKYPDYQFCEDWKKKEN